MYQSTNVCFNVPPLPPSLPPSLLQECASGLGGSLSLRASTTSSLRWATVQAPSSPTRPAGSSPPLVSSWRRSLWVSVSCSYSCSYVDQVCNVMIVLSACIQYTIPACIWMHPFSLPPSPPPPPLPPPTLQLTTATYGAMSIIQTGSIAQSLHPSPRARGTTGPLIPSPVARTSARRELTLLCA